MSLHNLAQHLQTAGRGDDKMLVHMTPKEVGGLQALAMAHGGSLTVNPQTGLPEAGFLSSILPMVAGLALGPAGLGLSAMQSGLITGAAGALMTGDLKKGLVAGLGAYGGAGVGAGLSAAGTGASFVDDALMSGGAQNAAAAQAVGQTLPNQVIAQRAAEEAAKAPFSTLGKGVQALGTEAGRSAFMTGANALAPYAMPAALGSAAMSNYYDELEKMGKTTGNKEKALMRPYDLKRDYSSVPDIYGRYFRDKYTEKTPYEAPGPEYAADGGLMGLGTNLPVEQMSQANAIGANTRYPMAYQTTSTYASPAERPISENLINPPGYVPTDPYTGAQRFADGGEARYNIPGGGSRPVFIPKGADPYAPQYAIQEGSTNIAPAAAPATATAAAAAAAAAAAPIRFAKTKKIADEQMIQNVFERLGGFGDVKDVAPDLYDKIIANKRSEQDIASFFRKSPYFSSAKYEDGDYEGRIQDVANAALGRNATPEEVAKLSAKPRSMNDLYTWFRTTQPKEFEKETATVQETRKAAQPENFATNTQIAAAFQSTFGRPPTKDELTEYSGLTPAKLQEKIKESDLYKDKLTGGLSAVGTPKFTTNAAGQQIVEGALSKPKSATERLGLGQFYGDMDTELKKQMATAGSGMRFNAPAAQTNLSALDQYYAPAGTNISQGSAEQAQLAALLAAQNVARQSAMYGIGPTVARAGSPGMFAPRFTSSGNIYSAGFYSPQFGSATAPATPPGAPALTMPSITKMPTFNKATGQYEPAGADGGFVNEGIASLGSYSDGGRLLRGPGDGVSDSIPASIGGRRPARLADGEFVVPARIVSELGNGSTEAGARQLYAMMDRIQKARRKSVGKGKVAVDSKSSKLLPA